jgi:hypothetical protein
MAGTAIGLIVDQTQFEGRLVTPADPSYESSFTEAK